ncbi:hypothetical protein CEXT_44751 [Caerostris extrusa]|uniref:Uncharacterized protein n=1 Tax=Caerostris extrusa TaxID=172846 RepID=A0AAV4TTS8_CAEEX|nr:hypothetical protein CEXT_44751 [Caerostris extrusa]
MLACHAGGPGSIPGRCTIFIFFQPAGRTIFSSEISTLRCTLVSKPSRRSIGGSVVECSPATRAARFRFPADARFLSFFQPADRTIFSSEISTLRSTLVSKRLRRSIGGSVVECSHATRAARFDSRPMRGFYHFFSQLAERFLAAKFPRCDAL